MYNLIQYRKEINGEVRKSLVMTSEQEAYDDFIRQWGQTTKESLQYVNFNNDNGETK